MDSVHSGDWDGLKGLYVINAVGMTGAGQGTRDVMNFHLGDTTPQERLGLVQKNVKHLFIYR
jgi:hypothetical protein